jgi:hypothetical protein
MTDIKEAGNADASQLANMKEKDLSKDISKTDIM